MRKIVRNLTGEPIELAVKVGETKTTTVIFGGKVSLPEGMEVDGDLPNGLLLDEEESPVVVEEAPAAPSSNDTPPVVTSEDDDEDAPLVSNKPKGNK